MAVTIRSPILLLPPPLTGNQRFTVLADSCELIADRLRIIAFRTPFKFLRQTWIEERTELPP